MATTVQHPVEQTKSLTEATVETQEATAKKQPHGRRLLALDAFRGLIMTTLAAHGFGLASLSSADLMGYEAAKTVLAKLHGQTPEKRIDSPATVVTVEDLSRPEINSLLHSDLNNTSISRPHSPNSTPVRSFGASFQWMSKRP